MSLSAVRRKGEGLCNGVGLALICHFWWEILKSQGEVGGMWLLSNGGCEARPSPKRVSQVCLRSVAQTQIFIPLESPSPSVQCTAHPWKERERINDDYANAIGWMFSVLGDDGQCFRTMYVRVGKW